MLRKQWKHAATCLGIWLIAGCGTIPTGATDTACLWDQPITYSDDDTPETTDQIQSHNRAWRAVCGN
jgi:hypothetical protein